MWQRHFEVPKWRTIIHLAKKNGVLSSLRRSSTNMMSEVPPAWRGSRVVRQYLKQQLPNRWIGRDGAQFGHHGHRTCTQLITKCGVACTLWRMQARSTQQENCLGELSELQDARTKVPWPRWSEYVSKQMAAPLNNLRTSRTTQLYFCT